MPSCCPLLAFSYTLYYIIYIVDRRPWKGVSYAASFAKKGLAYEGSIDSLTEGGDRRRSCGWPCPLFVGGLDLHPLHGLFAFKRCSPHRPVGPLGRPGALYRQVSRKGSSRCSGARKGGLHALWFGLVRLKKEETLCSNLRHYSEAFESPKQIL